jgi:hypothetical protein
VLAWPTIITDCPVTEASADRTATSATDAIGAGRDSNAAARRTRDTARETSIAS